MSCANMAARMPEPHILLSVTAPALLGRPPLNAAWRAGAWPWPAIRQLPKMTSVTSSGLIAGALDSGLDGSTAQVVGGKRSEVALKATHGRAGGADDHNGFWHGLPRGQWGGRTSELDRRSRKRQFCQKMPSPIFTCASPKIASTSPPHGTMQTC